MDRRPTALGIVAPAALALALLTGCGSDGEQLSAAELVARGDEICRTGQERFAEIQSRPPANAVEALAQTEDLVAVASDELNELRRLRPPQELSEAYERYLEARGSALELLEEGRDAAERRDAKAYAEAQAEAGAEMGKRRQLAAAVGFEICSDAGAASPGPPPG